MRRLVIWKTFERSTTMIERRPMHPRARGAQPQFRMECIDGKQADDETGARKRTNLDPAGNPQMGRGGRKWARECHQGSQQEARARLAQRASVHSECPCTPRTRGRRQAERRARFAGARCGCRRIGGSSAARTKCEQVAHSSKQPISELQTYPASPTYPPEKLGMLSRQCSHMRGLAAPLPPPALPGHKHAHGRGPPSIHTASNTVAAQRHHDHHRHSRVHGHCTRLLAVSLQLDAHNAMRKDAGGRPTARCQLGRGTLPPPPQPAAPQEPANPTVCAGGGGHPTARSWTRPQHPAATATARCPTPARPPDRARQRPRTSAPHQLVHPTVCAGGGGHPTERRQLGSGSFVTNATARCPTSAHLPDRVRRRRRRRPPGITASVWLRPAAAAATGRSPNTRTPARLCASHTIATRHHRLRTTTALCRHRHRPVPHTSQPAQPFLPAAGGHPPARRQFDSGTQPPPKPPATPDQSACATVCAGGGGQLTAQCWRRPQHSAPMAAVHPAGPARPSDRVRRRRPPGSTALRRRPQLDVAAGAFVAGFLMYLRSVRHQSVRASTQPAPHDLPPTRQKGCAGTAPALPCARRGSTPTKATRPLRPGTCRTPTTRLGSRIARSRFAVPHRADWCASREPVELVSRTSRRGQTWGKHTSLVSWPPPSSATSHWLMPPR